ncbi:MAG: T9SS type A sorting domain-containing protein [Vicingaceae bacterium]|nr:MAG: T9SS type A sorting domain-containing protein [Vicingaceae bacterium]
MLIFLHTLSSYAQLAKKTVFQDWVGNNGSQAFFQKSVVRSDASGNAHIAGATLNQNGNYDMYIAKYNASGVLLWDVVYAGAGGWHDAAADLRVDASGNVYVTGSVFTSSNDSNDVITLKYNSSGVLQWSKIFNGASSLNDGGTSLQLDASGNVYVSAFTQDANNGSDFLLLKYDNSGSLLLNQQFDLNNVHDVPVSLMVTSTRLAIAGATQVGPTDWDYLYVAYHPVNGSYISHSTSTGGTAGFDKVHDLQTDASGNFYLTGTVFNASTGYDILTVKLDDNLNVIWSANYNSTSTMNDVGNALAVDNAGNVMVTGFSETSTEGTNFVTIQYNSSGTQQWVKTFNGEGNAADTARAIAVDANNNVYITGSSFNGSTEDFYTTKYKSNGTELWGIAFNSLYNGSDRAFDIALDSLGGVLVSGQSQTQTGFEYATVKYIEKNVTLVQDTVLAPASWSFTANLGQLIDTDTLVAEDVKFYTQQSNPALYFQNDRFDYVWAKLDTSGNGNDTLHRVDMYFYNANTTKARAHNKQAFYTNYFLGYIPEHRAKVPHYDNLYYSNVWDNIDMQCGSDPKGFKYFIVVKPNGDPADIEFRYSGQNSLATDGNGNLLIISSIDTLVQPEPTAWEIDANGNVTLLNWTASYSINGSNVTLSLGGSYTSTKTLVLGVGWETIITGPEAIGNLEWCTYMGWQAGEEVLSDIISDDGANIFIAGSTRSSAFFSSLGTYQGNLAGDRDAILMKLNSNVEILWATYYGGGNPVPNTSEASDHIEAIALSNDLFSGGIFVTGSSSSTDLPIEPSGGVFSDAVNDCASSECSDIFVAKFNFTGDQLLWSTFYGDDETESATDITIDANDNVYIVGRSASNTPLVSLGGASNYNSGEGLIIKFDNTLDDVWVTKFAGLPYAAKADNTNRLVITGSTTSGSLPVVNNDQNFPSTGSYAGGSGVDAYDAFVSRFDTDNLIEFSMYYGGAKREIAEGLDIDGDDNIFVTGETRSNGFLGSAVLPVKEADGNYAYDYYQSQHSGQGLSNPNTDAFVLKLNENGTFAWSTYFGNEVNIFGKTISLDAQSYVYITGKTQLHSPYIPFPGTNPTGAYVVTQQPSAGPNPSGFVASFGPQQEHVWSTYLGGEFIDEFRSACVSPDNKLYFVGITNTNNDNVTNGNFFPLTPLIVGNPDYYQSSFPGPLPSNFVGFAGRFGLEVIQSAPLAVKEDKPIPDGFRIYPNPSSTEVFAVWENNLQGNITINICDISGKIVKTTSVMQGTKQTVLDVAGLTSGMYFIKLFSHDTNYVEKLLIQK